jgi:hypothetical protein
MDPTLLSIVDCFLSLFPLPDPTMGTTTKGPTLGTMTSVPTSVAPLTAALATNPESWFF